MFVQGAAGGPQAMKEKGGLKEKQVEAYNVINKFLSTFIDHVRKKLFPLHSHKFNTLKLLKLGKGQNNDFVFYGLSRFHRFLFFLDCQDFTDFCFFLDCQDFTDFLGCIIMNIVFCFKKLYRFFIASYMHMNQ
jgi:hypothetical protein